ncbi:olfactory receptor 6N1-like [Ascaphus truei]|uniref:olfactory receptor 6N1-like n=1 Tax=Ascaphus truei TaxID=8439 RepID=UPI003F598B56
MSDEPNLICEEGSKVLGHDGGKGCRWLNTRLRLVAGAIMSKDGLGLRQCISNGSCKIHYSCVSQLQSSGNPNKSGLKEIPAPAWVNGEYIDYIGTSNQTISPVTEFIIFGFPSLQRFQTLLFCVFLFIYLFTVTGNGTIFLLVMLDKQLQTPMYFFVSNLSFIDMSYTSVTVPKMLAKFLMNMDTISDTGCFMQMYFFLSLAAAECLLLAVMAYDRYLAICCPLHYHTIMTRRLYIFLSAAAWTGGFAAPGTVLILVLRLPFCGPNIIHHYYCDHPPLLQLACTDTSINVAVGSSIGAFIILISLSLVAISYIKIILSILKIASSEGRRKTFSTCASHFVVVNMFYLPLIFMYIRPTASYSSDVDSLVAMMYTVITPMMNPVIYSMRNKDIKNAFRKKIRIKWPSCLKLRMHHII